MEVVCFGIVVLRGFQENESNGIVTSRMRVTVFFVRKKSGCQKFHFILRSSNTAKETFQVAFGAILFPSEATA